MDKQENLKKESKMKRVIVALFAATLVFSPIFAFAEDRSTEVTIDLKKMDPETAKKILSKMKEDEEKGTEVSQSQVEKWKEIALGLGEAVKELCSTLNVEINAFIKTDAGRILTFVLIWKLVGASILSFLIKFFVWGTIFVITLLSFRYFHTNKKVKKDDGSISYGKIS